MTQPRLLGSHNDQSDPDNKLFNDGRTADHIDGTLAHCDLMYKLSRRRKEFYRQRRLDGTIDFVTPYLRRSSLTEGSKSSQCVLQGMARPAHLTETPAFQAISQIGAEISRVPSAPFHSVVNDFGLKGQLGRPRSRHLDDVEYDVVQTLENMTAGLMSGCESQKYGVLAEVQRLNFHCKDHDMLCSLIPLMCERVPSWNTRLQIAVADALAGVVGDNLPDDLSASIISTAFRVVRDQDDPEIYRSWAQVLVGQLPYFKTPDGLIESILMDVNQAELADAGFHRRDLSKKFLARIIGPLSVASNTETVTNVLLVRALGLLNESSTEIRCNALESIAQIGTVVDTDTMQARLWPGVFSLVNSSDPKLRATALRATARITAAHRKVNPDAVFFTGVLPPVFLDQCSYSRKMAALDQRLLDFDFCFLVEVQAEVFGELLFACSASLADEVSMRLALKAFQAFAACNGHVVRRRCASNVPGVSLCMKKRCRAEIAAVVESLSRDSDVETRRKLAAGMHETAKQLCTAESIDTIFRSFHSLLHDESQEVCTCVLKNLDVTLATFVSRNHPIMIELLENMFQKLQVLPQGNWRTRELLAKQIRLVAPIMPPVCLRKNILPLLYRLMAESSFTVRKASTAALSACLRHIPNDHERLAAMRVFCMEWACGDKHWKRMCFLYCAEAAVQTYSGVLFRTLFADSLARLAHDPISNIRIKLVSLLPRFAPACHQTESFQRALAALCEDIDIDVKLASSGIEGRIQREVNASLSRIEQDLAREGEEREISERFTTPSLEPRAKKLSAMLKVGVGSFLGSTKTSPAGTPVALDNPRSSSKMFDSPSTKTRKTVSGFAGSSVIEFGTKLGHHSDAGTSECHAIPHGSSARKEESILSKILDQKCLENASVQSCEPSHLPCTEISAASETRRGRTAPMRLSLGQVCTAPEEILFSPIVADCEETGRSVWHDHARPHTPAQRRSLAEQLLSPLAGNTKGRNLGRKPLFSKDSKDFHENPTSSAGMTRQSLPRAATWTSAQRKSSVLRKMLLQEEIVDMQQEIADHPSQNSNEEASRSSPTVEGSPEPSYKSGQSSCSPEIVVTGECATIVHVSEENIDSNPPTARSEESKTSSSTSTVGSDTKIKPIKLRHGTTYQKDGSKTTYAGHQDNQLNSITRRSDFNGNVTALGKHDDNIQAIESNYVRSKGGITFSPRTKSTERQ